MRYRSILNGCELLAETYAAATCNQAMWMENVSCKKSSQNLSERKFFFKKPVSP